MPLRTILRILSSRYGEDAVQKLSESYPMRRAAQLTAYLFHKGKATGEETMEKVRDADISNRAKSFTTTFTDEVKEGFKDLNKEIQRQRQNK